MYVTYPVGRYSICPRPASSETHPSTTMRRHIIALVMIAMCVGIYIYIYIYTHT